MQPVTKLFQHRSTIFFLIYEQNQQKLKKNTSSIELHIFWKNIVSFYTTPELPPFLHHKISMTPIEFFVFVFNLSASKTRIWNKERHFFHFETHLLMWKIKQSEHIFMSHSMGVWIQFFFYWLHLRSSASKPVEVIEKYWRGLSEHII